MPNAHHAPHARRGRTPALTCVAALALAGCGDAPQGAPRCPLEPYPGVNVLCPAETISGGLEPPPRGAPSIRSFTVSPSVVQRGDPVTLTAEFDGQGNAWFPSVDSWVPMTSGTPVSFVHWGLGEQSVELRVTGYVEGPPGAWSLQEVAATATFTITAAP